ncbi:MAG: pseudouridine synthase [Sphingomonas hengshuiensis]|uniref:Pseudouridine synthase n=1 Tax=Sphingomonas hengshuiensis TaxID=1609977 RepID=A0A2W5B7J7_9SPHN|nr:MAG: pseudouridine synthase [Sphingomonas hengshuiensis]
MQPAYTKPETREGDEGTASAETFVASPQTDTRIIVTSPESPGESPREGQRIAKLMARAGVASRRDVERMITAGRVALNGVVIETPATILPNLKGVTVDGAPVAAPEPTRLFRFHKPAGTLTAERDGAGRPTIYDRLPGGLPRLIPVGRLDLNTEGLLLMTTDGEFKRRLELPATGVERTYRARAYGEISQQQLEELMLGIEIEGVRYGPINANLERRTGTNTWIEMTLTEGKNREVRRVLEHLGLKVSRLIRTRYGPFHLEDLPEGEVDEIRQHELVAFRKTLASKPTSKPAPEGADPAALKAWRRATPLPRPEPVARQGGFGDERRPRVERDGQRSGFGGRRPDRDAPQGGERRSVGARPQGPTERGGFGARPQGDARRAGPRSHATERPVERREGFDPLAQAGQTPAERRQPGLGDRRAYGDRPAASDNPRARRAAAHAERPGYDGVARVSRKPREAAPPEGRPDGRRARATEPQPARTARGPVDRRMTQEEAAEADRASFVERPKRKPAGWAKAAPSPRPAKGKPKGGRPGGGKR